MSKLTAFVLAALVAALASTAIAHPTAAAPGPKKTPPGKLGMGPAHWYRPGSFGSWGPVPQRSAHSGGGSGVDNLSNPGTAGQIMPTTATYVIFWLPSGFHFSEATDGAYETQVLKYFQDVGGSQILNTATQYPGSNGTPADTSTFVTSVIDTTAFPHAGTSADPVTQGDLNNEVYNQITANSWPLGMSTMYFVFLPDNVVDCGDSSGASCNTNKYCAYHTYGYVGSDTPANDFVWADIPDNRSVYSLAAGCGNSNVTGNPSADTTLSSVEHEHLEAVTDPRLNAWQDSTGAENGDKCNRNMGVANSSASIANNYLGAGSADLFRIQREWSNAAEGCAASYTTTGSFVESPHPVGSDVTTTVAEATIPGNPADSLTYTLTFKNPSDQDDAYGVSASVALPAGVQYAGSSTATFVLGDLAPHKTATRTFAAHPAGPLAAGTVLTATATFSFDDSTGTAQPAIVRTATTTVVNQPPVLTVPGPQSQDYRDGLSFGVSATDADLGDTLAFAASGLPAGLTLTDNGDRTATVSGTITATPGVYVATISVADGHHALPVTAIVQITVTREETATTYTGPTAILSGSPVTLTATLLEDGTGAPVPAGQSVTLTVGVDSCSGNADPSGDVSCTIASVSPALGPQPISATFAGDTFYLGSADTGKTALVFAFPAAGAFLIGDATYAAATPSTTVVFWSSEWYLDNQLTGGPAPTDFKGFASMLHPDPPTMCGATWKSAPGNSPPPPAAPLPAYMGVLVTDAVDANGKTRSGGVVHIVVVQPGSGYAPNPGHDGSGMIVGAYC